MVSTAELKPELYAHRCRAECGCLGLGYPVDRIDIHVKPSYYRRPIRRTRRLNFVIFTLR
ncbi:protein of unknown function [Methylocaldum szegediense]|uniref:Uncharacterized protein n=1 Tax=Methylocaldum szegediense TaxID=73780 RepID=A0ABN8WXN9_9GAMM|nr:protein of unknown function [Methylocaldum szegediense]